MSKKNDITAIEAMLSASGMCPQWVEDYFEENTAETRARFLNAFIKWFEIRYDHHMFHFNNLEWLDQPSDTMEKTLWLIGEKAEDDDT